MNHIFIRILFFAILVVLVYPYSIFAGSIDISVNTKARTMTAYIKNADLNRVIEDIQTQKHLWIKGDRYLEGKVISIS